MDRFSRFAFHYSFGLAYGLKGIHLYYVFSRGFGDGEEVVFLIANDSALQGGSRQFFHACARQFAFGNGHFYFLFDGRCGHHLRPGVFQFTQAGFASMRNVEPLRVAQAQLWIVHQGMCNLCS